MRKKRNPEIVETIELAKKKGLLDLAKKLSAPISQYRGVNLDELGKVKESMVMVVGKVLGQGEINRKIKVSALGFSEQAKEKLKKASCEIRSIRDEIEDNENLKEVKIL